MTPARPRPPRPHAVARATLLLVAACVFLLVLLAAVLGRAAPGWVPEPVRNLAFDVRLAVGPPAKKAATAARMPLGQARVYLDRAGRNGTVATPVGGVPGTLYRPEGPGPHPGVLLLHGSTPEGRNMGLYRLMGRMLAQRGYVVLSIDHGSTGDAAAGLRMLESLEGVAATGLTMVGHSGGAAVAASAGFHDPAVTRIVAIGPGVRYADRATTEGAYFQRRQLRYNHPPRVLGDTFPTRRTIEFHMDYLARTDHKPLLLVQGAAEDHRDLEFLRQLHASMAGPAALLTVDGADHYMNVFNVGPLVVYDPGAADRLLTSLDSWVAGQPRPGCGTAGASCAWPGLPFLPILAGLIAVTVLAGVTALALLLRRRRGPVSRPAPSAFQTIEA
jgi:dienelactone hydrolase